MKKKIIFSMYNLDIGGIETALLNILKNFDYDKYDVTLFLERKEGIFLTDVPTCVNIINYNISTSKNIFIRKIKNRLNYIFHIIKYFKKYDCGICYASHRKVGANIIPYISRKNILWVHGNYWNDEDSFKNFYKNFNIKKYHSLVFVSNALKKKFLKYNNSKNQKLYNLNNIVDYKGMQFLSEQETIKKNKLTFLNVGRHTEEEKNLSMLIKIMKKIKEDGYDYELLLIGDGPDHEMYKKLVKELKLTKYIKFLGRKKNPFPYYKIADAILLTSKLEGNPVVFLESKVFNVPILTTEVSDSKIDIDKKYGLVSDNNPDAFYNLVKNFLEKGFKVKKKFDYKKYNNEILEEIYKIIELE